MRLFKCLLLALSLLGGLAPVAQAHELTLAEMNLYEFRPGAFQWAWATPPLDKPLEEVFVVHWPNGCVSNEQVVQCPSDKGMTGSLEVEGLGKSYSALLFNIKWHDGESRAYTLTTAQPRVYLYGKANDEREGLEIAKAYTGLGVEHILTGWDHLSFVISLLFLVGYRRRLIATITFFTLAHSITLALSALDIFTLRPAPVEVVIALSIMLVCYEVLKKKDTITHRWPELVAFTFGLLHGMGFAGALKEIGLPAHNRLIALLTFNVGVELGQLLVILVTWVIYQLWRRSGSKVETLRESILYMIGGFSMYWTVGRLVNLLF
jgi:hydrogenase/urease accessory protein HupE